MKLKKIEEKKYRFVEYNPEAIPECTNCIFADNDYKCKRARCRSDERKDGKNGYYMLIKAPTYYTVNRYFRDE